MQKEFIAEGGGGGGGGDGGGHNSSKKRDMDSPAVVKIFGNSRS